jgi:hypothetical protein
MRLPNQPNPAPHKRVNRQVLAPVLAILSMPLILLAGCASGTSSVSGFFSRLSPSESPTPAASPIPTATPTPTPTPSSEAGGTQGHTAKKTTLQAHVASKPSGTPSSAGAEVSLEPNPAAPVSGSPATPSARASAASVAPTAGAGVESSPSLESSGSAGDADPAKAAKLIQDVDEIEKRVDRTNLSADDSQRDILAQKLLLEARESLAERDNVAAMSLATKASTLLAPLPKVADSASPSAP